MTSPPVTTIVQQARDWLLIEHTRTVDDRGKHLRGSRFGFLGHHAGLGSPDLSGVLVDGAITGELAHGGNVLHYHLQPVFAVLGRGVCACACVCVCSRFKVCV